jgi:hypothetical protein
MNKKQVYELRQYLLNTHLLQIMYNKCVEKTTNILDCSRPTALFSTMSLLSDAA